VRFALRWVSGAAGLGVGCGWGKAESGVELGVGWGAWGVWVDMGATGDWSGVWDVPDECGILFPIYCEWGILGWRPWEWSTPILKSLSVSRLRENCTTFRMIRGNVRAIGIVSTDYMPLAAHSTYNKYITTCGAYRFTF